MDLESAHGRNPIKKQERDSQANPCKKTVARPQGMPKLVLYYGLQVNLRHAQACSGSTQVEAAAAYVRRLNPNQRKRISIFSQRVSNLSTKGPPMTYKLKALYSNKRQKGVVSYRSATILRKKKLVNTLNPQLRA